MKGLDGDHRAHPAGRGVKRRFVFSRVQTIEGEAAEQPPGIASCSYKGLHGGSSAQGGPYQEFRRFRSEAPDGRGKR
jgi:hypothetical protein